MEKSKIKIKEARLRNIRIPKFFHFGLSVIRRLLRSTFSRVTFSILIFTFLIISSPAEAGTIIKSPAYLGLSNGLVGCWNFDGVDTKAQDCTSNNNDGAITGAVRAQGKVGQALSFDGINDGVLVTTGNVMGAGEKTVSVWINPRTVSADQTMISNDAPNITELKIDQGNSDVEFSSNGGTTFASLALSNIKANTWQQLVVVRNSSNQATFYLNGVQVGTPNQATGSPGSATQTSIGYDDANTTNYFNGLIDEVRVYNRALSSAEISRLYRIGLGSTANRITSALDKGLVGHWTFEGPDISGTRAKDRSGFNNHGTLTGGASLKGIEGKVGQAFSFDGVNDEITTTNSFVNPQDFTISAWFKTASASGKHIISFESDQTGNASNDADRIIYVTDAGQVRFIWEGGSVDTDALGEGVISSDNVWHHAVGTHTSGNVGTLYIDGVSMGTAGGAAQNFTGYWRIGSYQGDEGTFGRDGYFPGLIDDVRIYNRALSASEVSRLYNSTQSKFNSSKTGDVMTKGLVGHWTFDGSDIGNNGTRAKDRSGNNNHGTLTGANGLPTNIEGKVGSALSFDGVDDVVNVGDINATDGTSFLTVSAWIKQDSIIIDKSIVSKTVTGTINWVLNNQGSGGFGGDGDDITFWLGNMIEGHTTANIHKAGVWEHWVAVFDGTQSGNSNRLKLYLNGSQRPASFNGTIPATTGSDANTIGIGSDPDLGAGYFFNGLIDDVRIYNRALSAGEIQKLYQMGR